MNAIAALQTSPLVLAHQQKRPLAGHNTEPEQLGAQLKAARLRQQLTLRELGQSSGVAPSTLSKIENNQLSPSFQTLYEILEALNLELSQLFSPPADEVRMSRRVLTRRGEGVTHPTPAYEHRLLAGDLSQKKLLPFTSTIRARSLDAFEDWVRHRGEEFLLVLTGSVELHCEFYQPVRLDAGDSSYLDSTMGHALISVSAEDAEVLWVATLS